MLSPKEIGSKFFFIEVYDLDCMITTLSTIDKTVPKRSTKTLEIGVGEYNQCFHFTIFFIPSFSKLTFGM